ncbi:NAD(P)-binding protein [Mycena sanguinolenta]|uniref:NAD(P)-binding protein n=1 Tax=Mycena sanguinolenta TaxID=230812 RepID=A0A8H6Z678_9AGAR|nr:NAD(P)-binding protein [Mycena sanguinolenta]
MAHPNFLLNSRVLVIGGSSGIGFAVASGAIANGSRVHITSLTAEKLSTKITQLRSLYPNAHIGGSTADLSNVEKLEGNLQSVLAAAVTETGGPLDHIVYTAGDLPDRIPAGADDRDECARALHQSPGRYLKPGPSSSITLTSGVGVHRPRPGSSGVISVGAAVEALSRALAVDLAPIRVNVVIPGVVSTELMERMTGGNVDIFKSGTLTKTLGTPEGAAEAYLFCMRSTLATGQGFIIDSGSMMAPALG